MNEFNKYITQWQLTPDGDPLITPGSKLLPVHYKGMPAMLKIVIATEVLYGAHLMLWWNGQGAANILAFDDHAYLMERAAGNNSLVTMAKQNQDDEASRIICSVVTQLHAQRNKPPPTTLVPLSNWFQALDFAAAQQGDIAGHTPSLAQPERFVTTGSRRSGPSAGSTRGTGVPR